MSDLFDDLLSLGLLAQLVERCTSIAEEDFATSLESIILVPEPLIVTGDLNIPVNDTDDPNACEFLDLRVPLGLKQHAKGSTHEGGHTLDLVITREDDDIIKSAVVIDRFISHHASALCPLNSVKPLAVVKEISHRQVKAIDLDALPADLRDSDLCTTKFTDVDEMASCYNSTLQATLDKHATLKTKTVVNRKRLPLFKSQMKAALRVRRKAESIWRESKSADDLSVFKAKKNHATFIMNQARCEYYTTHIQQSSCNQRKLFQTTKALLCDAKDVSFPSGNPDPDYLLDCRSKGKMLVKSENPPRLEIGRKKGYMRIIKELWDDSGFGNLDLSSDN
ncbi:hypothetical protein AWC38_SpisGene5116 [Stylophora pistillata]|uniref:Endonuclease/exonuclease/phosphatase domain-containing protein n=1 Tax=Stylophora pistillata TaxID=50429 RepID=A0A2B4SNH3_STYPI|nr:hypothetical protein AWC38_SpisGene5116 [Stylophora pistillata]